MKKVALIVDNEPTYGGTYQYNQIMIDAFHELPLNQYEKHVFYTNHHWVNYLNNYSFKLTKLNFGKSLKKIFKLLTLVKLPLNVRKRILHLLAPSLALKLNDNQLELIVFPSQDTLSLFTSIPKINVIHDLMHRYEPQFPEVSNNGRIRYRDILFKAFCTEAKAIIVDSEVGARHVQDSYKISENKIFTLPYIPPKHITEQDSPPIDFDQRYGHLPKNFLFYPAQFSLHKNHEKLIHATAKLIKSGIDVQLVFAGSLNQEYDNLLNLVKKLDIKSQITFLGFVPNEYLKGVYLKSRGLVMPTFFGPTNIPPLEAIFLGRPIAVSDIYGMPDQLKDAALYFNPNDIEDIAQKIKMLWQDEQIRDDLSKNGRKLIQSWNKKAFNDRFSSILNSIILPSASESNLIE